MKNSLPQSPKTAKSPSNGILRKFNLSDIRQDQNFADIAGVKMPLTTVPCRKPHKHDWIRVHPGAGYRIPTFIVEPNWESEAYVVLSNVAGQLIKDIKSVVLVTAITRDGVVFLWPLKSVGIDERKDNWTASAHRAAKEAETRWVRVAANMGQGAYELYVSEAYKDEPQWPDESFEDIVSVAFGDRFISDFEHPVVKRLLGR